MLIIAEAARHCLLRAYAPASGNVANVEPCCNANIMWHYSAATQLRWAAEHDSSCNSSEQQRSGGESGSISAVAEEMICIKFSRSYRLESTTSPTER